MHRLPQKADGSKTRSIRLIVAVNPKAATPREARTGFAAAIRQAIMRAFLAGRLDVDHAEELWRVVPDPERA